MFLVEAVVEEKNNNKAIFGLGKQTADCLRIMVLFICENGEEH